MLSEQLKIFNNGVFYSWKIVLEVVGLELCALDFILSAKHKFNNGVRNFKFCVSSHFTTLVWWLGLRVCNPKVVGSIPARAKTFITSFNFVSASEAANGL